MNTHTHTTLGPAARFGAARGLFLDLDMRGFRNAFTAHGDPLDEVEIKALHDLWYGRRTPVEADLPLIERLEAVAEKIKAANQQSPAQ